MVQNASARAVILFGFVIYTRRSRPFFLRKDLEQLVTSLKAFFLIKFDLVRVIFQKSVLIVPWLGVDSRRHCCAGDRVGAGEAVEALVSLE